MRETKRKPKRFDDDDVLYIKVAENNFLNQFIVLEVIKLPNLTDPSDKACVFMYYTTGSYLYQTLVALIKV